MIGMQNAKIHAFLSPIDINGVTATDTEVDTTGYSYLTVVIRTGNVAGDMSALTLNESDTAAQTGTAFVTFTAPAGTGGDNTTTVAFIDLRKRKRYISLVATASANATLICVLGFLTRADEAPDSATERGIDQQVII